MLIKTSMVWICDRQKAGSYVGFQDKEKLNLGVGLLVARGVRVM
jgi:hypothetical protein